MRVSKMGCEEASVMMAMAWVRGKTLTKQKAEQDIIAVSKFEEKKYGSSTDTSAQDTARRILKGYFKYDRWVVAPIVSPNDIIRELNKGKIAIVPVNGRALKNPYYKPPGPRYHMLVIIGYDSTTKQFITNDPGTRRGRVSVWKESAFQALRDYPSGEHQPIAVKKKFVILLKNKPLYRPMCLCSPNFRVLLD